MSDSVVGRLDQYLTSLKDQGINIVVAFKVYAKDASDRDLMRWQTLGRLLDRNRYTAVYLVSRLAGQELKRRQDPPPPVPERSQEEIDAWAETSVRSYAAHVRKRAQTLSDDDLRDARLKLVQRMEEYRGTKHKDYVSATLSAYQSELIARAMRLIDDSD